MNRISLLFASLAFATGFDAPFDTFLRKEINNVTDTRIKGVDCIYVINLQHRTDRWARMNRLLAKHEIGATQVFGIYGKKLSTKDRKKICGKYPRISNGPCGALLSHLSVILNAKEKAFSTIWVLEDDIEFLKEPKELIPNLIREIDSIDPEWDIVYTDTNSRMHNEKNEHIGYYISHNILPRPDRPHKPKPYYFQRKKISNTFTRIYSRFGVYSMIVSKRGVRKIFNYFRQSFLFSHYDIDIHYIPGIRQYATNHDWITNTSMFSSDATFPPPE